MKTKINRNNNPKEERQYHVVGRKIRERDAEEKVSGSLKFAVDYKVADMVYGKILRSPHAHARIKRIDTSKAEEMPGVLGVVTHEDIPRLKWEGLSASYYGCIFDGVVRFVGDEVAAVAATSEKIAEAALELIAVDYELLPAVFNPAEAMKPDAPKLLEEGNVRPQYKLEWGNPEQAEAESDFIVEDEVQFRPQAHAPMGRNACISYWEGDKLTLMVATQTPSELQSALHQALGIPMSNIRVISVQSGTSFGLWWCNNFMMICAVLSRKVKRPVKLELSNYESLVTVKKRHAEIVRGKMGCNLKGELIFAKVHDLMENGAYGIKTNVFFQVCDLWGRTHHGRYTVQGVSTNLVTSGCMRGVGDVTMGSLVERLADRLAEKVGMSPLEFRLKNQIRAGEELRIKLGQSVLKGSVRDYMSELPPDLLAGWPKLFHLSSGDTQELLRLGAKEFRWEDKWKGWRQPYAVDGTRRRAVGIGTGIHCCGVDYRGAVSALVRIHEDGSVTAACATGRMGQGAYTMLGMIVAEELGISFDRITVITGDTSICPWNHGSTASTTTFRGGWAIRAAAADAKHQLLDLAAREVFNSAPEDLEISNDYIKSRIPGKAPDKISVEETLNVLRSHDTLGQTISITGRPGTPIPPTSAFSRHFAGHFVDLEVDIETGEIRLLNYLAAQDSGTVINPEALKNQMIGGAICGAGFALCEGLIYNDEGIALNPNFVDYKLLRANEFPTQAKVLFCESPDQVGPFGARSAGEAPTTAATPAIAQAVYNAIGVWVDVPMTPERVWTALEEDKKET